MSAERRVLVVDDDAGIRVLVTRLLKRHGYEVDAVRDGAEAIEALLQHDYALVMLDLMMPRFDGFAVVRYLREYHPELLSRVIVMTAFGSSAIEQVCPPVERVLEKPFDIQHLLNEVAQCEAAGRADSASGPRGIVA